MPRPAERVGDRRMEVLRDRHRLRGAAVDGGLHHQPLVVAAGFQQLVPGLDVADDGHALLAY